MGNVPFYGLNIGERITIIYPDRSGTFNGRRVHCEWMSEWEKYWLLETYWKHIGTIVQTMKANRIEIVN